MDPRGTCWYRLAPARWSSCAGFPPSHINFPRACGCRRVAPAVHPGEVVSARRCRITSTRRSMVARSLDHGCAVSTAGGPLSAQIRSFDSARWVSDHGLCVSREPPWDESWSCAPERLNGRSGRVSTTRCRHTVRPHAKTRRPYVHRSGQHGSWYGPPRGSPRGERSARRSAYPRLGAPSSHSASESSEASDQTDIGLAHSGGVYAGSTRLPFGVFGRQRSGADSLHSCGFSRLGATGDDS